jgi:hypothetical protein
LTNFRASKSVILACNTPVPYVLKNSITRRTSDDTIWYTRGRSHSRVLIAPTLPVNTPVSSRICFSNTRRSQA